MNERLAAERTVRELNAELERRVSERTAELEKALEQKALFVRETHHRVKNNLQIVLSLLNLQISSAGPELRRHLEDTLSRIRSIGLVHEQLYRSDIASIDLRSYLEELLDQVSSIHGSELGGLQTSFEGSSVVVDVDRAVPIGLICNEVLSNALKHAFDGGDPAMLKLGITRDANSYRITISDNGRGLPADLEERSSRPMGIQVVRGLAAQIGATAGFRSDNGATFELTVPSGRIA